jgi:hypothetical protein
MDDAPHERNVLLLDLSIGELPCQLLMGAVVLRHYHQPGRAAIEAMDDAGPQFAADTAQVFDVMEKRIHECSARMSGARVNDHAGGFVEDDDIPILEYDPDRKRLWFRESGSGCGNLDVVLLPRAYDRARTQGADGSADVAILDEALHIRARLVGKGGGQEIIESRSIMLRFDGEVVTCQCSMLNAQCSMVSSITLDIDH